MPFNAHLLRVYSLVRFEIIERATSAPRPRAQCAPIVQLARLTMVRESDDSFRQSRSIIRLDAGRKKYGVTPALRQYLLLPSRTGWSHRCGRSSYTRRPDETELHDHRNRPRDI